MTKSKDSTHKHARVGGESALEVRRPWISNSLATNTGKADGPGGLVGGGGDGGRRWQGCGGWREGWGLGGVGGGVEGRAGEEDRVHRDPLNKPRVP